jgi:oligoendopeptidase F
MDEGIDINNENFWQKGFDLVNEKITELITIKRP